MVKEKISRFINKLYSFSKNPRNSSVETGNEYPMNKNGGDRQELTPEPPYTKFVLDILKPRNPNIGDLSLNLAKSLDANVKTELIEYCNGGENDRLTVIGDTDIGSIETVLKKYDVSIHSIDKVEIVKRKDVYEGDSL